MVNLLAETVKVLEEHGRSLDDIIRILVYEGCSFESVKATLSVDQFVKLASETEYDDGYGTQEICNMVAYGINFWLFRNEYDGSEWWEYVNRVPSKNTEIKSLKMARWWEEEGSE